MSDHCFFQNNKLGLVVRPYLNSLQQQVSIYRMRAIISHDLYIFYPIFHCGLYCRAVNIADNLCTKQGNSSTFWPEIRGL